MVGVEDSSVMRYESVIYGHYVYKRTWSKRIGEI